MDMKLGKTALKYYQPNEKLPAKSLSSIYLGEERNNLQSVAKGMVHRMGETIKKV